MLLHEVRCEMHASKIKMPIKMVETNIPNA